MIINSQLAIVGGGSGDEDLNIMKCFEYVPYIQQGYTPATDAEMQTSLPICYNYIEEIAGGDI